jgi:hypothetical protein
LNILNEVVFIFSPIQITYRLNTNKN